MYIYICIYIYICLYYCIRFMYLYWYIYISLYVDSLILFPLLRSVSPLDVFMALLPVVFVEGEALIDCSSGVYVHLKLNRIIFCWICLDWTERGYSSPLFITCRGAPAQLLFSGCCFTGRRKNFFFCFCLLCLDCWLLFVFV